MVKKSNFLQAAKFTNRRNRFLVILRFIFSTYYVFPGQERTFPVSKFKEEYFNEKISSLAGLNKKSSIFS